MTTERKSYKLSIRSIDVIEATERQAEIERSVNVGEWQQAIKVPCRFDARTRGQSKANMRQGILALQHMPRLWREIPAAGRIWKLSLLFLFNGLIALVLFNAHPSFSWGWVNLNSVIFGLIACLDFFLLTCFLFPTPALTNSVTNLVEPTGSSSLFTKDVAVAPTSLMEAEVLSAMNHQQTSSEKKKSVR